METRYISINKNTKNHQENLEKCGYEVTETGDGRIAIQCSGVLDVIDLSTPEKAEESLRELVSSKQVLGYHTVAKLPQGEFRLNGPFANKVGKVDIGQEKPVNMTCFVTKGEPKPKATARQAANPFEALGL